RVSANMIASRNSGRVWYRLTSPPFNSWAMSDSVSSSPSFVRTRMGRLPTVSLNSRTHDHTAETCIAASKPTGPLVIVAGEACGPVSTRGPPPPNNVDISFSTLYHDGGGQVGIQIALGRLVGLRIDVGGAETHSQCDCRIDAFVIAAL